VRRKLAQGLRQEKGGGGRGRGNAGTDMKLQMLTSPQYTPSDIALGGFGRLWESTSLLAKRHNCSWCSLHDNMHKDVKTFELRA